jgi:hypothetical protein
MIDDLAVLYANVQAIASLDYIVTSKDEDAA